MDNRPAVSVVAYEQIASAAYCNKRKFMCLQIVDYRNRVIFVSRFEKIIRRSADPEGRVSAHRFAEDDAASVEFFYFVNAYHNSRLAAVALRKR
jgi:hypothetical protein